jgi:uncharacterized protein (TIGR02147 family)
MKAISLPTVFSYSDFRLYLADYQLARQKVESTFTKSIICKHLGLPNSRSYFSDVINGKKVTPAFVERFLRVLTLPKEDAQFFRVLVKFNQSEDPDERELYLEQLVSLNRTPKTVLDKDAYTYFSKWYNTAIRAILDVIDFSDNYQTIVEHIVPSITAKQAKEAIILLKKLSLIHLNEHGFWKPSHKAVTTSDYIHDALILKYQDQCLSLARKAVVSESKAPRQIFSNTLSVSEAGYKRIEKFLYKFRAEARSVAHKDDIPADRVYQLNVQLFPMSKIKEITSR